MARHTIIKLDAATLEFITAFGQLVSEGGLPPSIGRVIGLLVIAEVNMLTAEHIQQTLQLSSGAVSSALKLLQTLGYIKRSTMPGQRRYYYTFDAGSWQQAIDMRLAQMLRGVELADQGLTIRPGDPRLVGMRNLYAQLYDVIKDVKIETD